MLKTQTEESKYIKRINQQLKEINTKYGAEDNPLIAKWSRAIRESGLEFSIDGNSRQYRIANTRKNWEKIGNFMAKKEELGAQSLRELRDDTRAELRAEAAKKVEKRRQELAENGKPLTKKEARKIEKEIAGKQALAERLRQKMELSNLEAMLSVIYGDGDTKNLGGKLSELSKGIPPSRRDKEKYYSVVSQIEDEYYASLAAEREKMAEEAAKKPEKEQQANLIDIIAADWAFKPRNGKKR